MGDRNRNRTRLVLQNESKTTMLIDPLKPLNSPSGQLRVAAQSIGATTVDPDFIPSFASSGLPSSSAPPFGQSPNAHADVEVLPKYRVNRTSFARNLQPLNLQDEPSLSEILEQERNAWLDSTNRNLQTHPDEDDLVHDVGVSNGEQQQLPIVRASRPKQKSYFQEGSMNETSKAVASTWEFLSDDDHNRDQDDIDRTPRAAASSRASTCSSIDINEFKPLPATPSTFKNTIKRLGQRVVNSKPVKTIEPPKIVSRSEVKGKRGLRKSISSWKIFNGSLSDWEGDSGLSMDGETPRIKKTKTPNNVRNARPQYDGVLPPKSVLDERKRKAELAYSQQFATMRKKPRYSNAGSETELRAPDVDDYAQTTIRQRDCPIPSTGRLVRRRSHGSETDVQTSFNRITCPAPASIPSEPPKRASSLRHNRSHSDDSELRSAYKTDCLKKQSRSELEKENQRLRLMLRRRGTKTPEQGHHDDAQEPSHVRSSSVPKHVPTTSTLSRSADRDVGYVTESTQMSDQQPHNIARSSDHVKSSVHSQPPGLSPFYESECITTIHIPPMPSTTSNLQHRGPLSVASGNIRRTQETSTMKRRVPVARAVGQAELPRPLSMVLEGVEHESDEEREIKNAKVAPDDENGMPESKSSKSKAGHSNLSRSQQWTWPEDVF